MGNIVILGPRWSGKTTYLTGLAYWPTRGEGQSFEIEAINQDAKKLVGKAKDIIKQKDYLEATKKEETKESIYLFQLDVKKKFSQKK